MTGPAEHEVPPVAHQAPGKGAQMCSCRARRTQWGWLQLGASREVLHALLGTSTGVGGAGLCPQVLPQSSVLARLGVLLRLYLLFRSGTSPPGQCLSSACGSPRSPPLKEGPEVGCPCGVQVAAPDTAGASSRPSRVRGLRAGASHARPCLQVQTTTMCISVSLSGTVVLGCLFTPKLHIILFQPQKNVASHRVGTARFSVAAASSSQSHGEHGGAGEGIRGAAPRS